MRSPGDKFDKDFYGSFTQDGSQTKHPWKWSLQQEGVQEKFSDCVWIDRFGVWCGWVFFLYSVWALSSYLTEWEGHARLNQIGNSFNTLTSSAFMTVWCFTTNKPPWKYALGVFLYAVGYIIFAAYYSDAIDKEIGYHMGSWAFMIGSVFLLLATYPTKLAHSYPHLIEAQPFWAAFTYTIGSVFFCYDAWGFGDLFGESISNVTLGLVFFMFGRWCSMRGSCTWRCTAFFERAKTQNIGKSVPGLDAELAAPLMSRGKHITAKLNAEAMSKIAMAQLDSEDDAESTSSGTCDSDSQDTREPSTDEEETTSVSKMHPAEDASVHKSLKSLRTVRFSACQSLKPKEPEESVHRASNLSSFVLEPDSVHRGSHMSTLVGDCADDGVVEPDAVLLTIAEI